MARSVRAWLQMVTVNPGTAWERPSSEASYTAYGGVLSAVYPANGGACDAIGQWIQYPTLCESDFALNLKSVAHSRGQLYMPMVWNLSKAAFEAVLDDPEIGQIAITNLVTLATTRIHDSPWDGVDFDIEDIADAYKDKLTAWLHAATDALHAVGMVVNVTTVASDRDSGLWYNRHVYDFAALAGFVDTITVRCYTSFGMHPNTSPGPYDLVDRVLGYILSKGAAPDQLFAGLAIASRYVIYGNGFDQWPTALVYTSYKNARIIASGVPVIWYETGDDGKLFRLKRAFWNDIIPKEAWFPDDETVDAHLELINRYGVNGIALFIPGSEPTALWGLIEEWKAGGNNYMAYLTTISTSTLTNQNISSALLVHTWTNTTRTRKVYITVDLDQIAGGGDYVAYLNIQRAEAGNWFETMRTINTVAAGVLSTTFHSTALIIGATDVVRVYVKGLAGDTTTPDIITTVYEEWLSVDASGNISLAAGTEVALEDDAITAAKFDETTAFPLAAEDAGATILARTGDEMDLVNNPNATALNEIADAILVREISNVEPGAPFRSLYGAIAKLVNRFRVAAGTASIYATDDSTVVGTQAATTNPAAEPITELDTT